eukprot:CAMPEP_0197866438 /NCGR_PEP_ID=MMETSP1438-20131217/44216_1 /TAXON_ID=1461541 /ORGANISM="Pterosperma sp., Strain CCMP1384" /LENGTH=385 /DNA_ID=CAMNT_0043485007 /DNA_START=84 /DNA_END=1241 /DNA_ORIENTATION=-
MSFTIQSKCRVSPRFSLKRVETRPSTRASVGQSVNRHTIRVSKCSAGGVRPEKSARSNSFVTNALAIEHDQAPYYAENEGTVEGIRKTALITAIKTPYLKDGRFDLGAYDALVETQINNGVEGLIIGGTTGEGHLMSWDEHIMLIAHTANRYGQHLKVIGNTGSNSTREALHATQQGFAVGMDAALQINPYYGKTSQAGLLHHFNAVLDEGPAIVYNVPGRTGQDIVPDTVRELATHENFIGIKECTGNDRIKMYSDEGISCWSGNDDEAHDARHLCGAKGVISVTSNIVPSLFRTMMDIQDEELNQKLQPLINWMFREPNPIGLNTILAMGGLCKPVFRLPYCPMSLAEREEAVRLINDIGLENTIFDSINALNDDDILLRTTF